MPGKIDPVGTRGESLLTRDLSLSELAQVVRAVIAPVDASSSQDSINMVSVFFFDFISSGVLRRNVVSAFGGKMSLDLDLA